MADVIVKVAKNFSAGNDMFEGIDKDNTVGKWRINIPYSAYTGEDNSK